MTTYRCTNRPYRPAEGEFHQLLKRHFDTDHDIPVSSLTSTWGQSDSAKCCTLMLNQKMGESSL